MAFYKRKILGTGNTSIKGSLWVKWLLIGKKDGRFTSPSKMRSPQMKILKLSKS
jgi:hypothetical protein